MLPGGLQLPFHRQFQRIARKGRTPIVPVCLDQTLGQSVRCGARPLALALAVDAAVSRRRHLRRAAAGGNAGRRRAASAATIVGRERHRARRSPAAGPSPVCPRRRPPAVSLLFPRQHPAGKMIYSRTLAGVLCADQVLSTAARRRPNGRRSGCRPAWAAPSPTSRWPCSAKRPSISITPSSPEAIQSALRQCGIRHVLTSRRFTDRMKLDPGPACELIYFEDSRAALHRWMRSCGASWPCCCCRAGSWNMSSCAWAGIAWTTWPRSFSPAAAPASRRASCSGTATSPPTSSR